MCVFILSFNHMAIKLLINSFVQYTLDILWTHFYGSNVYDDSGE